MGIERRLTDVHLFDHIFVVTIPLLEHAQPRNRRPYRSRPSKCGSRQRQKALLYSPVYPSPGWPKLDREVALDWSTHEYNIAFGNGSSEHLMLPARYGEEIRRESCLGHVKGC